MRHGVGCADNAHCCPHDAPICDTDQGVCTSEDGKKSVPWTTKVPASYSADAPPEARVGAAGVSDNKQHEYDYDYVTDEYEEQGAVGSDAEASGLLLLATEDEEGKSGQAVV